MCPPRCIHAFDWAMWGLTDCQRIFEGKFILFSEDFQLFPAVKGALHVKIVHGCGKTFHLYRQLRTLRLTKKMEPPEQRNYRNVGQRSGYTGSKRLRKVGRQDGISKSPKWNSKGWSKKPKRKRIRADGTGWQGTPGRAARLYEKAMRTEMEKIEKAPDVDQLDRCTFTKYLVTHPRQVWKPEISKVHINTDF